MQSRHSEEQWGQGLNWAGALEEEEGRVGGRSDEDSDGDLRSDRMSSTWGIGA